MNKRSRNKNNKGKKKQPIQIQEYNNSVKLLIYTTTNKG
jgi:hypothetical protein